MAAFDFVEAVVAAVTDGHGELQLFALDLTPFQAGLRGEDIVERGETKASARAEKEAEVLGMSIGCADEPEENLRFEEGGLVLAGNIRGVEEFEEGDHARPMIGLIFLTWRHGERLAAIFLRQAKQPA